MRRWARLVLFVCVGGVAGGCGSYAGMQAELAAQGREGLRRVEGARAGSSAAVVANLEDRRRRLADAFELDVRGAGGELSPEWVISAGRGYAAGLERLAEARLRQEQADRASTDNAAAADEALALLERMLRRQARIGTEEVRP